MIRNYVFLGIFLCVFVANTAVAKEEIVIEKGTYVKLHYVLKSEGKPESVNYVPGIICKGCARNIPNGVTV